jgi:hypothetical protein
MISVFVEVLMIGIVPVMKSANGSGSTTCSGASATRLVPAIPHAPSICLAVGVIDAFMLGASASSTSAEVMPPPPTRSKLSVMRGSLPGIW